MALFIGLGVVGTANADTFFYTNTSYGPSGSPSYYSFATSEVGDDVPFTGSHLVSSFRIGYRSSVDLLATFRFYGVDPTTGLPGQLVAQLERPLPAADFANPLISLTPDEQFIYSAEPNLLGQADISGGWFSMQFVSVDGSPLYSTIAAAQMADGPSKDALYDFGYGKLITLLDTTGIKPVSFLLVISEIESDDTSGSIYPEVSVLRLFPSSVVVGSSSTATVTLSSQAPAGGVSVKVSSDKKGLYFSRDERVVKEGDTSTVVTVLTTKSAGPKGKRQETTATITAEGINGDKASAILTITK